MLRFETQVRKSGWVALVGSVAGRTALLFEVDAAAAPGGSVVAAECGCQASLAAAVALLEGRGDPAAAAAAEAVWGWALNPAPDRVEAVAAAGLALLRAVRGTPVWEMHRQDVQARWSGMPAAGGGMGIGGGGVAPR